MTRMMMLAALVGAVVAVGAHALMMRQGCPCSKGGAK